MDLTAKSVEEKLMPLLVCKEIPNNMKLQNMKDKRQPYYRFHWDWEPWCTGQSFGASHSLNEWETHLCFFSFSVQSATVKSCSQHPDQATWKIPRPREDLWDSNCNLPRNEDNSAYRTLPLAAAHSTSWTPFLVKEVWNYQGFLERIFYPEARRARAVCFILSFLSPTHFLFYSREISELFVISAFRRFHCPSCSMDYQWLPS